MSASQQALDALAEAIDRVLSEHWDTVGPQADVDCDCPDIPDPYISGWVLEVEVSSLSDREANDLGVTFCRTGQRPNHTLGMLVTAANRWGAG